jgi:hypothetical protein
MAPVGKACLYDINSYLTQLGCNSSQNYGYNTNPCVLIKLNNVYITNYQSFLAKSYIAAKPSKTSKHSKS